jgi:hypothetical protein
MWASFAVEINPGVFTGCSTTDLKIPLLGGMAYTGFWVHPREELIGIYMIQILPESPLSYCELIQPVAYVTLID